jgi:S1-C subfamily serine protease
VDPTLVDITVTLNGGQTASGTGIVLTSHGVVLTNNHVVEGATSISVTDVGNGQTYSATVLGYDRTRDIAVIKLVHASGLRTAKIGSSTSLAVGTRVVAIGNAGGAGGTPSVAGGTITALHRAITASDALSGQSENLSGLIEINANVQPGDSGGSLVNGSGHVIGVDTAASQSFSLSSQSSQGYAIPITTALQIVHQIEARRSSSTIHVGPTAYLGVLVTTAGPSAVNPYGQPGGGTTVQGAAIRAALGGGPASVAGLAPGDVITSVDAHRVTTAAGLSVLMETFTPGEHVRVGWTDPSGVTHTTSITLGTGPAQ